MAKAAPVNSAAFSPLKARLVHAVVNAGEDCGESVAHCADDARPRQYPQHSPENGSSEVGRMRMTPMPERRSREKRILLSRREEIAVNGLVERLSSIGAGSMRFSHLLRACMLLLRHSEGELLERLRSSPPLIRPANDNQAAIAEFESCLAREVAAAISSAPPLRPRVR